MNNVNNIFDVIRDKLTAAGVTNFIVSFKKLTMAEKNILMDKLQELDLKAIPFDLEADTWRIVNNKESDCRLRADTVPEFTFYVKRNDEHSKVIAEDIQRQMNDNPSFPRHFKSSVNITPELSLAVTTRLSKHYKVIYDKITARFIIQGYTKPPTWVLNDELPTAKLEPGQLRELYPALNTTADMFNMLTMHPNMLEDGIPLSIVMDLTDTTLSMSDLMLKILSAIENRENGVLIEDYKLGSANIDKLKDLGYIVKLFDNADSTIYSISGWSEYEHTA